MKCICLISTFEAEVFSLKNLSVKDLISCILVNICTPVYIAKCIYLCKEKHLKTCFFSFKEAAQTKWANRLLLGQL